MMASDVIYKYRNWNDQHHKNALLLKELHFASPNQLNDPFDFKIRPDFSMLDTADKINQFADDTVNVFRSGNSLEAIEKAKTELVNKLMNNPLHFNEQYIAQTTEHENLTYGVLCFSQVWDNILMWTHYADNHKGFCLGFEKAKMPRYYGGGTFHVNYRKEYPRFSPLEPTLRKLMFHFGVKSEAWDYEEEYRIVKMVSSTERKSRILNYNTEQIKEVILGLRIEPKNESEIIEAAKNMNVPVFRIIAKPHTFELDRVRLNL